MSWCPASLDSGFVFPRSLTVLTYTEVSPDEISPLLSQPGQVTSRAIAIFQESSCTPPFLPRWGCPNFRCSAGFQPALSRQDGGATFKLGQHLPRFLHVPLSALTNVPRFAIKVVGSGLTLHNKFELSEGVPHGTERPKEA